MNGLVSWIENLDAVGGAVLLTAIECVGDRSAKLNGAIPVYLSYNALAFVLPHLLKKNPLGLTNAYWNACTNVTGVLIGGYYGEALEFQQIVGVGLISVGIYFLGQGKQSL